VGVIRLHDKVITVGYKFNRILSNLGVQQSARLLHLSFCLFYSRPLGSGRLGQPYGAGRCRIRILLTFVQASCYSTISLPV